MLNQSSLHSLSDYLLNISLTEWQNSQLQGISTEGIYCLLEQWAYQNPIQDALHCNATWDETACWPATAAGTTVSLPCSEVMRNESRFNPAELRGDARRTCLENRTWDSSWRNYDECEESVEDILRKLRRQATPARYIVRYILYYGSIASVFCLCGSLFIFCYFKSIRCERIKIHMNMMLALLLKSLLMIIMVHHTVFKKSFNYKRMDWVCKLVISLQFYGTVAAINWMFVQGHYLNSRLTNIVVKRFPMKYYLLIGWGFPLVIVGAWSISTEIIYGTKCWKDYGKMKTIWILVVSLSVVLLVNLFLLINILRVVISSVRNVNNNNNLPLSIGNGVRKKITRGTKAATVLFPLLGIANLLFFYNPGGNGQKYYMVAQASMHSFQGIVTSILYCFICKDVRDVMRREYYKFQVTRGRSLRRGNGYTVSFSMKDSKRLSVQQRPTKGRSELQRVVTVQTVRDGKSEDFEGHQRPNVY